MDRADRVINQVDEAIEKSGFWNTGFRANTILKEFTDVSLSAGYENGPYGVIFSGQIMRVQAGRANAVGHRQELPEADQAHRQAQRSGARRHRGAREPLEGVRGPTRRGPRGPRGGVADAEATPGAQAEAMRGRAPGVIGGRPLPIVETLEATAKVVSE